MATEIKKLCKCGCKSEFPIKDFNVFRQTIKRLDGSSIQKVYTYSYSRECQSRINKENSSKSLIKHSEKYAEYRKTYKRRIPADTKKQVG